MNKNILYIDTHTHTNLEPLYSESEEIIQESLKKQVGFNVVGIDLKTSKIALEQAKKYDHLTCSVGIHPTELEQVDDQIINQLEDLIKNNLEHISCIGECGLDYYHELNYSKEKQKEYFIKQIELAKKYDKPLMLHIRYAHDDAIAILKEYNVKRAIIHCFTDKSTYIDIYNELDYYISIPGVITYKPNTNNNLLDLYEAVRKIKKNRLLIETDAPWLAPTPFRGKTNYPYYVIHTLEFIANILNISKEEMQKNTFENALRILIHN